MANPLKKLLKIGLPVAISAVLVYWVFRQIENPEKVWEYMGRASIMPFLILVPISLFSHWLRAWRWRRFIGEKVSVFYGFTSVMIGYAVNDVLPRVGEVARVVNMNRMTKVPVARLVTTLIAERFLDVLALVLFLGLSILIEGQRLAEQFPKVSQAGLIALALSLVGLAMLYALAFASGPIRRLFGKMARPIHPKLAEKGELWIEQGAEGLAFLKNPRQAFFVFIETAAIWILYLVCFLLGLMAFGVLESIGLKGGTVVFSITSSGVLVPAVGAIGPYHQFGLKALTDLFAMDPAEALAVITVTHAVIFYFVGGVCGALAWILQIVARRKQA